MNSPVHEVCSLTSLATPASAVKSTETRKPTESTYVPEWSRHFDVDTWSRWRDADASSNLNHQIFLLKRHLERLDAHLDEFSALDVHYETVTTAREAGLTEGQIAHKCIQDEIDDRDHLPQSALCLRWCLQNMLVQLQDTIVNKGALKKGYDARVARRKKLISLGKCVLKRRRERKAQEQAAGAEPSHVVGAK